MSDSAQSMNAPGSSGLVRAPVNRSWWVKQFIVALVMLGFGAWGLADALVIYPKRGFAAARFLEWQYLQKLQESGRLDRASVESPRETLAELARRSSGGVGLSDWEIAQRSWLEALKNTGGLVPERTRIPRDVGGEVVTTASERIEALKTEWTTAAGGQAKAPQPLTFYDIPVQWLFVSIGFPVGIYLLWLIAKVFRQKYQWDAANKILHLPDGSTLGLADIADFDKRKWHKYLIYLQIKPGNSPHAGKEVMIDLLRHRLIEDWVLEMERILFPDRAEKAEEPMEPEPGADAPAPGAEPVPGSVNRDVERAATP